MPGVMTTWDGSRASFGTGNIVCTATTMDGATQPTMIEASATRRGARYLTVRPNELSALVIFVERLTLPHLLHLAIVQKIPYAPRIDDRIASRWMLRPVALTEHQHGRSIFRRDAVNVRHPAPIVVLPLEIVLSERMVRNRFLANTPLPH